MEGMDLKVNTNKIIKEVAHHTGQSYSVVGDVVYSFLHYVQHAAVMSGKNVPVRGAGAFRAANYKGRKYLTRNGTPSSKPDRLKVVYTAKPLLEVRQWKNMESLQQKVISALSADLKPQSMDLSICVQIAGVVLSNPPITTLTREPRTQFIKKWIQALGVSPLTTAKTDSKEFDGNEYDIVRFRIRGKEQAALVFHTDVDDVLASICSTTPKDILFFKDYWTVPSTRSKPPKKVPYGGTIENQCQSLFMAYQATKYGYNKTETPSVQEED